MIFKTTALATILASGLLAGLNLDLTRDSAPSQSAATESRAYLGSRNLPGHGVAIEGFSPVSYFDGQVRRGSALFAVEHEGVTYHLANADEVRRFKAKPGRYTPAFGGWCAFGMSVSDKFPIDPEAYLIVNDRLFLFLRNPGIDARALWQQGDERELLKKAEAHWRKVQG